MSSSIVLAAGGTGGHLYPAEALAQELLDRGHKVTIITDKRGDAFKRLGDKVQIHSIRAATFKAGIVSKIKAVIDICLGMVQAALLLRKIKPSIVVGFGGYPSFPTVYAAQWAGYRTVLHEQNAVLGKANWYLANDAGVIAASLPGTQNISEKNRGKVVVTGNPVRAGICAVRDVPYPAQERELRIFITGGSTALTRVFNETVPAAAQLLPEDIRRRLRVVHQCRAAETEVTLERYRSAGVTAEIKSFFDDMPERLSACHLFIGRSGASTVAEIAVVGRPAIFVPYPGHADMQQKHNAMQLSEAGGAWIIMQDQFTPEALAKKLAEFAGNLSLLQNAAKAAKSCGQPEAVKSLADVVERSLSG